MIWFGFGIAKVIVITLVCFFPLLLRPWTDWPVLTEP